MPRPKTLSEIASSGVRFEADEAVAVIQQLITAAELDSAVVPPLGPPSLDNVFIDSDGSVACHACATSPAVLELGILLQAMLPPDGQTRIPGALRYAMARALLEVNAPPFDSVAQFSAVLHRYESADRQVLLQRLYVRASIRQHGVANAPTERRRHVPSATELRRQLRKADEERYVLLAERAAAVRPPRVTPDVAPPTRNVTAERCLDVRVSPVVSPVVGHRGRAGRWLLGGSAAVVFAFFLGYAVVARMPHLVNQPREVSTFETDIPGIADVSSSPEIAGLGGWSPAPPPSSLLGAWDSSSIERVDGSAAGGRGAVERAIARSGGTSFSPSFAATGNALFFHTVDSSDDRSALQTTDLTDRDRRVVTIVDDGARNYHVQPSPDGDRIAYDSDRDGERGVYIANRDGSGVRRVSGRGYAGVPTWSPDGRQLAFIRAEAKHPRVWNLWLLTLKTGDARRLTHFRYGQTWNASWFADGMRICYAHEDRLFIHNLASGGTRAFESPMKGRLVRTPAVSPDGKYVMFQVVRNGVWLLDVQRGTMDRVLTDATAEEFAWSRDGRRVAFHSRRDGEWGIWLITPHSK